MVWSPSCKISYAGAEFNTLKLALSIDVERAGEEYGMLFVLLTVHSNPIVLANRIFTEHGKCL